MIHLPAKHRILIVDDEPDVSAVTRLSLRGASFRGRPVEFAEAATGKAAVEDMRARPDTAVILLDVVMETSSAGLDACRAIREELSNSFVRILLRTGQPGVAPEKKTIDEYDIDGYLPKAELTTNRLYAAVRTSLKAFEELVELARHRHVLSFLHDSVSALRSFESLEATLQRILTTAVALAPSPLAILDLQTFEEQGKPRRYLLHLATEPDSARAQEAVAAVTARVAAEPSAPALRSAGAFRDGFLAPLVLHRELGHGWIYLEGIQPDALQRQALVLLASHAANALYSAVAQGILGKREGAFYDSLIV
jgi:CheY-like chemotaxis protein